jgi:hypothetical protein
MSETDLRRTWCESAERLLERIPGVVSARIEGSRDWVTAVRVWYEPNRSVAQVMAAVDECLIKEGARLAATQFDAVVAQPDRRTVPRPRPQVTPQAPAAPAAPGRSHAATQVDAVVTQPDRRTAPRPRPDETPVTPAAPAAPAEPAEQGGAKDTYLKLVGHKIDEIQPGVIGVQVWIEWRGRAFSGAATGPSAGAGALRTPALATLRALHSCLQVLYEGSGQPGLVLETVVRITIDKSPIVVAALTAAERARPRLLTAAWPDKGEAGLPAIMATLHATSRTVLRWLNEPKVFQVDHPAPPPGSERIRIGTPEQRLILANVAVDHGPSGNLDVGVRLTGFGESVDRRRSGRADEAGQLELGATATLDAVHDLLKVGGSSERDAGDLRHAGACRLRTGEHDIVVILAEAMVEGRSVQLAGAASADSGLERAAVAATLQATNPLVANHAANVTPPAGGDGSSATKSPGR